MKREKGIMSILDFLNRRVQPKNSEVSTIVTKKVDYYECIIDSDRILIDKRPEFNQLNRPSEQSYKNFLTESQPYIDEYLIKGTIENKYNQLQDMSIEVNLKRVNEERRLSKFRNALFGTDSINVSKTKEGYYRVAKNGRHRLYVAKKYKIRVLVHVILEEQ